MKNWEAHQGLPLPDKATSLAAGSGGTAPGSIPVAPVVTKEVERFPSTDTWPPQPTAMVMPGTAHHRGASD